jgi:23S rRNA-/tRNA-specific pseudouridylate synthase
MQFTVSADDGAGERLDRYLQRHVSELSRARLQDLIKSGHILLNAVRQNPVLNLRMAMSSMWRYQRLKKRLS